MDYSKLGQAAAATDDLTQERKSFERKPPRAGVAFLRLRDYIETGKHEPLNPTYKPSLKVMLVFELNHPDHMEEFGDSGKQPMLITVRVNKTYSDKGRYIPLFKALNRCHDNKYQHIAQMIGKEFMGTIYHNKSTDGKTTYANLDLDKAWSFKKAEMENPITMTTTAVPIPEMVGKPKVFLWEPQGVEDAQIIEMWDSLFIEGTRTNASGEEISKNWIQNTIMENIEWEGSVTQALTQESITLDESSFAPADNTGSDAPF